MLFRSSFLTAAILMAPTALSQTPLGTQPNTTNTLAVAYGTTKVTPGITLSKDRNAKLPTITFKPSSPNQTYTLLLVDLSISTASLNISALVPGVQVPLSPGISANRTTRLHYWQAGITFSANGTLSNSTPPIAAYQGPSPPAGDIAHTYTFYLFQQSAGFAPPPPGNPFSAALVDQGMNRMSFSVPHLASEKGVGSLVGANYFMVQNISGSATATGTAKPTGTGGVKTPTGVSFKGDSGRLRVGLVGGLVTAFAVGCAMFLWT